MERDTFSSNTYSTYRSNWLSFHQRIDLLERWSPSIYHRGLHQSRGHRRRGARSEDSYEIDATNERGAGESKVSRTDGHEWTARELIRKNIRLKKRLHDRN